MQPHPMELQKLREVLRMREKLEKYPGKESRKGGGQVRMGMRLSVGQPCL